MLEIAALLLTLTSCSVFTPESAQELRTAVDECVQPPEGDFWTSEAGKRKRAKFSKDGRKQLIVITDFDRTLTPLNHKGARASGSNELLWSALLSTDYVTRSLSLKDHFYPVTSNLSLPDIKRVRAYNAWWDYSYELLFEYELTRDILAEAVESGMEEEKFVFRTGAEALLRRLNELDIPVVIFSGAVSNVIEQFLREQNLLFDNIAIVANRIRFDDAGNMTQLENELIHGMNKDDKNPFDQKLRQRLAKRSNVLVLGDNIGDANMAKALGGDIRVLKHGFLNDKVEDRLARYQGEFDELTLNDGTFKSIAELIEQMDGSASRE